MEKHRNFKLWILSISALMYYHVAVAQNNEIETASKLQKVIVFTNRAMISKDAVVSVKKGENIVRFSGITPNLIDQSVQISLIGQMDMTN